ncbi:hypothetical protein [Algibacter mikhailovii]|uniref:hypothetical protein n=1 Tax=Algibacter mikhailovii TaxID=425498 RepID=UPI001E3C59EA|nr:hypothetical protein [Algibacter mikhailovii]
MRRLKKVNDYYQKGKNLSVLCTVKVILEYADEIKALISKGLAMPSKHITGGYSENKNTNKKVGFILRRWK